MVRYVLEYQKLLLDVGLSVAWILRDVWRMLTFKLWNGGNIWELSAFRFSRGVKYWGFELKLWRGDGGWYELLVWLRLEVVKLIVEGFLVRLEGGLFNTCSELISEEKKWSGSLPSARVLISTIEIEKYCFIWSSNVNSTICCIKFSIKSFCSEIEGLTIATSVGPVSSLLSTIIILLFIKSRLVRNLWEH